MIAKNKGNEKFFKFTEETAKLLRSANLSKNARTLWDYIVTTNPFGDEEITATEILTELNWKEHTYYRAKKELEKAGLVKTKKHQCTLISTLKTRLTKAVSTVTKTVKEFNKNGQTIDANCQNESLKALSINDSGFPQIIQTNSDLSDQSEEMKEEKGQSEKGKVKREDNGLINEEEIESDNKLIDHQEEPLTIDDERLKNEEFIRYAQGKLPKARDIKRYLLTKDKTTGDRILERLWLEYQQWKSGKTNNPNSTGSEYFDNLIEEYKKTKPWESFNWEAVNWDKLTCFNVWLAKVKNSRDYTFADDNGLGYTRNLRVLFYRWYEQFYSQKHESKIPINSEAMGLINPFKQIMGGVNYAY